MNPYRTETPRAGAALPGLLSVVALAASGCISDFHITDDPRDTGEPDPGPEVVDLDEDGFSRQTGDCDDLDPDRGPAPDAGGLPRFLERCDGVDNDCAGGVDTDGEGFQVCGHAQTFTQKLVVDVLFVVDRHPETESARLRAADAASRFLQHLVGDGQDLDHLETHVGVVTTDLDDADHRGKLVAPPTTDPHGTPGGVTSLSSARTYADQSADDQSADDDSDEASADTTDLGDDGDVEPRRWIDGRTDPRAAAILFLQGALASSGVQTGGEHGGRGALDLAMTSQVDRTNAGFFRPGAPLALVMLSTLEDPTRTPSVESFLGFLDGWNGDVTAHAIVQTTSYDCAGNRSPETEGRTYRDLSNVTGGLVQSVCAEDFGEPFSLLGQTVALEGLGTRFPLEVEAQPDSLRVSIRLPDDGLRRVLRPDEIALSDAGRTLVLLTDDPPPAGTEIHVDYLRVP